MELIEETKKGCRHPERPIVSYCYKCGKGLCFECSLDRLINTRVVSWSSIDVVKGNEFGKFCPYCYLEEHYKKIPKKPKFIVGFGIGTIVAFIICLILSFQILWGAWILLGVVELIIVLPSSAVPYKRKKKAYINFKRDEEYLLRLLGV